MHHLSGHPLEPAPQGWSLAGYLESQRWPLGCKMLKMWSTPAVQWSKLPWPKREKQSVLKFQSATCFYIGRKGECMSWRLSRQTQRSWNMDWWSASLGVHPWIFLRILRVGQARGKQKAQEMRSSKFPAFVFWPLCFPEPAQNYANILKESR